jgi:hypothetical protein
MTFRSKLLWSLLGTAIVPTAAFAQVPDLVAAFDAGGRAMGMGGVTNVTGSETLSNYYNPAGLGYVTRSTIGATFRNFPESKTSVTGDIGPTGNARLDTNSTAGANGLGHAGLAIPLKGRNGSTNGTIGISVTAGGRLRDERTAGPGLVEGGLQAGNFSQLLRSDTSFVNVSYGRATGDGTFSWGAGLVYAVNRQVNQRVAPSGVTNFDAQATGLGAQIGFLLNPKENPDLSFGLSYRTPIKLRSGSDNPLIYSEVQARLAGGIALRRDGFRGQRDFMVIGLEGQFFFAGKDGRFIDRNTQTVIGLGLEYNYSVSTYRIPIRLGYSAVSAGGDSFARRSGVTFGFGFRPVNGDWSIDLNFGRPNGGANDASVGVTYKFGK